MFIWVLLAIFIAMFCGAYIKFDKDIVAPAVVLVAGYTFSIICATANIKAWAIDLHWETVAVLTYGTGLFVVTGYLVKQYMKKKRNRQNGDERELKPIEYNRKYVKYFCVYQILVMVIWVANIYYVTSNMGEFNSFSEMMVAFREWSSYSTEWMGSIQFTIINQLQQICTATLVIFVYLLAYNYVVNNGIRRDYVLCIPIFLTIAQMLLGGGRLGIVQLVMTGAMLLILFYRKYKNIIFKINIKLIVGCVFAMIIGGILFYYAKAFVGRGANDLSIGKSFGYITMYVGGPIQLLDVFLFNPVAASTIWGKETFYSLNTQLIRLGILDINPYIIHLEFRNATTGVFLGNIYTAYRSYIYDFGYIGLTVLPVIFSASVNSLYYKILYDREIPKYSLLVLLYIVVYPVIFFDFVRCFFFADIISFGTLKKMLILIGMSYIFIDGFNLKRNLFQNKE